MQQGKASTEVEVGLIHPRSRVPAHCPEGGGKARNVCLKIVEVDSTWRRHIIDD